MPLRRFPFGNRKEDIARGIVERFGATSGSKVVFYEVSIVTDNFQLCPVLHLGD